MKLLFGILAAFTISAAAESINGLWDATIQFDETTIPFLIEFSGASPVPTASFFNGDERITSTSGKVENSRMYFRFGHYATVLEATLTEGVLKGTYGGRRNGFHPIAAKPHLARVVSKGVRAPDIAGLWTIPIESSKGEHAWHLIVQQSGLDVSAAILRVDGDTGALTGSYEDGKFVLNHFDGARAYTLEMTPISEGSLKLVLRSSRAVQELTAVPSREARAKEVPEPDDPQTHTRAKNAGEPFRFSFPGLDGKLVSNTDARFRNKVVLVNITGSWCPNCHDEAPFLAELYRRYRSLGLEIVAVDFEEPEQLADKSRLRAFVKNYGIEYTYLIGGEPSELQAKIPQAEHLDSWPTTFFLGRDGRVRSIHAGFAAPASGEFHTRLKREMTETIERLLAERGESGSGTSGL
jgi:thiol-disulfide isomerase/thioredoxin